MTRSRVLAPSTVVPCRRGGRHRGGTILRSSSSCALPVVPLVLVTATATFLLPRFCRGAFFPATAAAATVPAPRSRVPAPRSCTSCGGRGCPARRGGHHGPIRVLCNDAFAPAFLRPLLSCLTVLLTVLRSFLLATAHHCCWNDSSRPLWRLRSRPLQRRFLACVPSPAVATAFSRSCGHRGGCPSWGGGWRRRRRASSAAHFSATTRSRARPAPVIAAPVLPCPSPPP